MTNNLNSYTEQGAIQLVSNETFVLKNQPYINFKVERLNSLKGDAEVSWKVFDDSDVLPMLEGKVQFVNKEIQQIFTVYLNDSHLKRPTRVELFNPTNMYKLGIIKMAKIIHVGMFFTQIEILVAK